MFNRMFNNNYFLNNRAVRQTVLNKTEFRIGFERGGCNVIHLIRV